MTESEQHPEHVPTGTASSASAQSETLQILNDKATCKAPLGTDDAPAPKVIEDGDRHSDHHVADFTVLAASRLRTRRAFLAGGAATAAGFGFYQWLEYGPHHDMLPTSVDRAYDVNAAISRAIFRDRALAPTYSIKRAEVLRVNGVAGLKKELKLPSYRLQVVGVEDATQHPRYTSDVTAWEYQYAGRSHEDEGHDTKIDPKQVSTETGPVPKQAQADKGGTGLKPRGLEEAGESYSTLRPSTPGLLLTLEDITSKLPRHELVTQFKCIEGWSQIVHWAGVRMADFLELYPPALISGKEPRYVYMETPDGDYYVGYDMHICRHPQTLLVTEMMGVPLTQNHGAPLRVHMPTKYGYKQIKRVGLISYTNDKPDDYWTKLGYDWYAGL